MPVVENVEVGRRVSVAGDPLDLRRPRLDKGIGIVITKPTSTDLISGVGIEPNAPWPDDRGYFLEVARMGENLAGALQPQNVQVSAAASYPGTIKAFHYHQKQTDYWAPIAGMFQVALVDLRADSPSFGAKNTLYIGSLRPWRLLIPPGVAHGYKVVGTETGVLTYLTSHKYDPADEGRIPHDDPEIGYDWELQHK
ncbi:MAG: dTDP-4-dehydrorhamnose 3,5-epimerase family protein [Pirellulales bacterium]|nr:dTDP-4-dehydrorhamnose 3,5-epimerase family protein [Pirellulales bacterium]